MRSLLEEVAQSGSEMQPSAAAPSCLGAAHSSITDVCLQVTFYLGIHRRPSVVHSVQYECFCQVYFSAPDIYCRSFKFTQLYSPETCLGKATKAHKILLWAVRLWVCKLMRPLWKTVQGLLKKLNTELL